MIWVKLQNGKIVISKDRNKVGKRKRKLIMSNKFIGILINECNTKNGNIIGINKIPNKEMTELMYNDRKKYTEDIKGIRDGN